MIGPYPQLEDRRASELYRQLLAVARVMLPDWNDKDAKDDFGNALLQIAARLGEQVTSRLLQTPQRDALAFFDLLDIPVQPPKPATAPLVFLLADDRETPVFAPARIQIGASTDDSEILFETREALNLTPARLEFLASADAAQDRVMTSPPGFLGLEPRDSTVVEYTLASFAAKGSQLLQVEPMEGLAPDDRVRINGIDYRVDKPDAGLIRLVESLEAQADENSAITKVGNFTAFDTRDLQQHAVYIGHDELLNLEEASTIELQFTPPSVAENLLADVDWELFATSVDDDEPKWRTLKIASADRGVVVLGKDWVGKVEQSEEPGEKNRWLRGTFRSTIGTAQVAGTRVRRIELKVRTSSKEDLADPAVTRLRKACAPDKSGKSLGTFVVADGNGEPTGPASEPTSEGSDTIDQAFHNGTPLPLSSRFFPFGPEPQRFDTFSIAAPEAFSKPGATITLDITTTDASILAMQVAQGPHTPTRAYGVANNGSLQVLVFDDKSLHWRDLDQPQPADLGAAGAGEKAWDLELSAALPPQAIQLQNNGGKLTDIVVVRDKRGALWSKLVVIDRSNIDGLDANDSWRPIESPSGGATNSDLVISRRNVGDKSVLISISGEKLYIAASDGVPQVQSPDDWKEVTQVQTGSPVPVPEPALGAGSRLVAVQANDWPNLPSTSGDVRVVVLDEAGAIWHGTIAVNIAGPSATVDWAELHTPGSNDPRIDREVRPSAMLDDNGDLVVFYGHVVNDTTRPYVLRENVTFSFDIADANEVVIRSGSSFQCFPRGFGDEPLGIVQGAVDQDTVLSLWDSNDEYERIVAPVWLDKSSSPSAFAIEMDGSSTLVINGAIEQMYLHKLAQESAATVDFFHALVVPAPLSGDIYVEPNVSDAEKQLFSLDPSPAISGHGTIVYKWNPAVPISPGLVAKADTWNLWNVTAGGTGALVPGEPKRFNLAAGGSAAEGSEIMIDGRRYTVDAPGPSLSADEIILTEDLQTTVATPSYGQLATASTASISVLPEHLLSLVRTDFNFSSGATPQNLRLRDGSASPPNFEEQTIVAVGQSGGSDWVLLAGPYGIPPGASLSVALLMVDTGTWTPIAFPRDYQNPELAWEYLRGDQWRRIETDLVDTTDNLAKSGAVSFVVPADLVLGDVAGQTDYWIRARLIGGDYGRPKYVVTTIPGATLAAPSTQTVTVDTSNLRPPQIIRIDASFSIDKFVSADRVLVRNNLDTGNQSQANLVSDAEYELFEGAAKLTSHADGSFTDRALFFGFTKAIDDTQLSIFVDAVDQDVDMDLVFEVLTSNGWYSISAKDETRGLHRRGFIRVSVDRQLRQTRRFGQDLFWLRIYPLNSAAAWQPVIRQLYINATTVTQARTIRQEIIASSSGEHGQQFLLANNPVLPESLELRVRESLSDEERESLQAGSSNGDVVVRYEELSIDGEWVLWQRVDSFVGFGPDDRVYRLDPVVGKIDFGKATKAPPGGANNIRAVGYQAGGGEAGNVPAFSIASLKSAVEGVDSVANPVQAAGGSEKPDPDQQIFGAPARLQRAGRALMPTDIEAICVASSPDIVRARCRRVRRHNEAIRVAVAARTGERCPKLPLAERSALAAGIRQLAWGALDGEDLVIDSPDYVHVVIDVRVFPQHAAAAAELEQSARSAINRLLHPIDGGPDGNGWPFGRRIWQSDILRSLSGLPGFDRAICAEPIARDGAIDLNALSATAMICADLADIRVRVGGEQA